MKKYFAMFGAAGLLAAMMMIGGCGSDDSTYPGTTPTTTAAVTTTTAHSTTTTAAGTTTTAAVTTTTPSVTTTTLAVTTVSLDAKGTDALPVTLNAATGAFTYTDSAAIANNVIITGFGADDKINVTGATALETLFSANAAGDVVISIATGNGIGNKITLTGVAPGKLIFNAATFNALTVGDITFQ